MKLLYISKYCDNETLNKIYKNRVFAGQAAAKFHRLLIDGLLSAGAEIRGISTLPVTSSECKKKFIKAKKYTDGKLIIEYPAVFNLPIIKRITAFLQSFVRCLFSAGETAVIIDVLDVSSGCGAVAAAKLRGLKTVGIVTDMPDFMEISQSSIGLKINHWLVDKCSAYMFLTEYMNSFCNNKEKPYIVIEGFVDKKEVEKRNIQRENLKSEKFISLYAGGLHSIYGLDYLVDGFLKANLPDSELHIYGDGDYATELTEIAKKNKTVKFYGLRSNNEVLDDEYRASLLINPRPSDGEYTKYSFPSKTLEYMSTGTPVLTTKLPGISAEYDEFLYYITEENAEGIAKELKKLYNIKKDELLLCGKETQNFVFENKSNTIQAKRLISFIKKIIS